MTVDGRRFRVTVHAQYGPTLVAFLHPVPRHRSHPNGWFRRAETRDTEMRFKVFLDTAQGLVTNIVVQAKRRRDGWADAMVRALIELYPGRTWTVEAPNEQSGQLFVKLASRLRGTVVAPVEDTTLPIDDPRRYRTPPTW
ncbi:hypothetical protein [Clavibacter michiganensis]|uniref:hypothetical protein n=1 Tax=Clavibacter michiganensis TaxID=28447 RepID=UPI002930C988|nr:hypothetical protein [Clavibacter michiganensis]